MSTFMSSKSQKNERRGKNSLVMSVQKTAINSFWKKNLKHNYTTNLSVTYALAQSTGTILITKHAFNNITNHSITLVLPRFIYFKAHPSNPAAFSAFLSFTDPYTSSFEICRSFNPPNTFTPFSLSIATISASLSFSTFNSPSKYSAHLSLTASISTNFIPYSVFTLSSFPDVPFLILYVLTIFILILLLILMEVFSYLPPLPFIYTHLCYRHNSSS